MKTPELQHGRGRRRGAKISPAGERFARRRAAPVLMSLPECFMSPNPARLAVTFLASCAILLATPSRRTEARPVPRMDHVIVVIMENKGYDTALSGTYTQNLVASATSFSN